MEETLGTLGNMGLPLGPISLSGSQWVHGEFLHCHPVGTQRARRAWANIYFTFFFYDFMFTGTNLNFTHSQQTNTDTQQSWGTRTAIQAGWDVCTSADNKWRWIGGSGGVVWGTVGAPTVLISRFQLAVQPSMETLISLQTVIYIYYPAKEARST